MKIPQHWQAEEQGGFFKTEPIKFSQAENLSLNDCDGGEYMAILPYFREEPLPVLVEKFTITGSSKTVQTVSLKRGLASNRYLTDEELSGAQFFKPQANASF